MTMEEKKRGVVKRKLTEQEKQAAARLKQAFVDRKRVHGYTQETLGVKLGWSQASVSQYFNAVNPLGLEALLSMCALIGVDPHDIYPELAAKLPDIPNGGGELLDKFSQLSISDQSIVTGMIEALLSKR